MLIIKNFFPFIGFIMWVCLLTTQVSAGKSGSEEDYECSIHMPYQKSWENRYRCDFGGQDIDFADDVGSWDKLYQLAAQLKQDLITGETFTVTDLEDKLLSALECLIPDSGTHHYLQALYEMWFREEQEKDARYPWRTNKASECRKLEHYRKGADKGCMRAKRAYYNSLFYGQLGDADWPDRFKILTEAAAKEDEEAKFWIAKALAEEKFILDDEPSKWNIYKDVKRKKQLFPELEERALSDIEAQRWLSVVISQGRLYQYEVSDEKRFQALVDQEGTGDPVARSLVDQAIYLGDLGQSKRFTKESLSRLLKRETKKAEQSLPFLSPHHYVNRSLLHSRSKWKARSGFAGYIEELKAREAKGDWDAGHCISKALYETSRFDRVFGVLPTPQERYTELVKRAKKGDQVARCHVCDANCEGKLGQKSDEVFADALFQSFTLLDILLGVTENITNRYTLDPFC